MSSTIHQLILFTYLFILISVSSIHSLVCVNHQNLYLSWDKFIHSFSHHYLFTPSLIYLSTPSFVLIIIPFIHSIYFLFINNHVIWSWILFHYLTSIYSITFPKHSLTQFTHSSILVLILFVHQLTHQHFCPFYDKFTLSFVHHSFTYSSTLSYSQISTPFIQLFQKFCLFVFWRVICIFIHYHSLVQIWNKLFIYALICWNFL